MHVNNSKIFISCNFVCVVVLVKYLERLKSVFSKLNDVLFPNLFILINSDSFLI